MYNAELLLKVVALVVFFHALVLCGAEKTAPASISDPLLERARNGEAQAQLEAGFAFYRSNNPVRAAYWFQAAAKQGIAEAQYNAGRCYLAGYGVEKNLHQALDFFKLASEHDLPPAQLETAKLLLNGIAAVPESSPPRKAIEPDEKTAVALLEKAAAKRYTPAMTVYAEYLIKKYRQQKPQKIIALLEMAITGGDRNAPVMLADFLLNRTDQYRDEIRARRLLENSAADNPEAMAKLAFAVEHGFGAPPEPEKAFKLYSEALKKVFIPLAAARLANYYYSGSSGVKQDIQHALKLYTQAAAAGIPEAITQLAVCSKNGIGMKADKANAFELFFQAAKMDHAPAQYELGVCFANGEGTVADQKGAFYWFNQAAMRYEPRALLESGKRYLYGNGTEIDAEKAVAYLEQAYANGMNEAAVLLEEARRKSRNSVNIKPQELPKFGL